MNVLIKTHFITPPTHLSHYAPTCPPHIGCSFPLFPSWCYVFMPRTVRPVSFEGRKMNHTSSTRSCQASLQNCPTCATDPSPCGLHLCNCHGLLKGQLQPLGQPWSTDPPVGTILCLSMDVCHTIAPRGNSTLPSNHTPQQHNAAIYTTNSQHQKNSCRSAISSQGQLAWPN